MKEKSLVKNYVMNMMLTISSVLFPLITFPYITRILLPEGTGRISFATSIISYFILFSQLGVPIYGVREGARCRNDERGLNTLVKELLLINFFMSLACYLILTLLVQSVAELKADDGLIYIISISIFFNAIGLEWYYKALEEYSYITIRSIFCKIIALVAMFVLVKKPDDVQIYGGISIFASSASFFLNFINARKRIFSKQFNRLNLRRHIKPLIIFFAMACATTIYTHIDSTMLGFMKGAAEVGYYDASIKTKGVLSGIVTALGAVILPRASSYYAEGNILQFKKLAVKAINFIVLLSLPLCCFFILNASNTILVLCGKDYLPSVIPMQIIMPTIIFVGLSNMIGIQILVPIGKEKIVLYSEIVGALVDIIINALLIPTLGCIGAAIGTVVAEMVVLTYQSLFIRGVFDLADLRMPYIDIALGLISSIAIWLTAQQILHVDGFINLVISAFCFFSTYVIVLFIRKNPIVIETLEIIANKLGGFKRV